MTYATYNYAFPSALTRRADSSELFLSEYSEVELKQGNCFFWGRLTEPFVTSRCLLALSKVVRSNFTLTAAQIAAMRDPIVTAGNGRLRFEGFSGCAGVYARVDVLPQGHDGEFPECGTTNVDFNDRMLRALNLTGPGQPLMLSVGPREVGLYHAAGRVKERKVPLPAKWIKGLTTVQIYQSAAVCVHRFNRLQALRLFRSIPKGDIKVDYYLTLRGSQPVFTPVKSPAALCVGGLHRLRLLEQLLPYAQAMHVFAHPAGQITVWQLYFNGLRFSLSLSRECYRGFSGEGAALASLTDDVPAAWIEALDNYSYANQQFNPTLFAIEQHIAPGLVGSLSARLAAMGLLGFDLDDNAFFYRRLPFKLSRIMSLNPRLQNAEKLIAEGRVSIVEQTADRVEARVLGSSGTHHTVILDRHQARCTCQWSRTNEAERGYCKHILAVKKLTGWQTNS